MLNGKIEIKNSKNNWIIVELLTINKGGTITFKYKGNVITRHCKKIRWKPAVRVIKTQGSTVKATKADKRFKTKKNRRKNKKGNTGKNKQGNNGNPKQRGGRKKVVKIAGHRVTFL